MINRTFGAPLGGTTLAGQNGLESRASRSIVPPNFCGGGGSWSPGMVMVAAGEPGWGAACCVCCASAGADMASVSAIAAAKDRGVLIETPPWKIHRLRIANLRQADLDADQRIRTTLRRRDRSTILLKRWSS